MRSMRFLAALLLLLPFGAGAQAPGKTPRLCFLTFDPAAQATTRFQAFFKGLLDLGYVEGKNILLDIRSAEGAGQRFPELARQCVESRADVIVVTTTPAAQAAKQATSTIPIVMSPLADPVGAGLVKSLARPGGNVTGQTHMAVSMSAKRLSLLKEAFPRLSRVLVLSYLVDPIAPLQIAEMQKVATATGLKLQVREIRAVKDYAPAFEAGARERVEAVIVTQESIHIVNRALIVELAVKHRLPSMLLQPDFVEIGGLMSYAADLTALRQRTAIYVDRVLKGAKPADLPVEQPSKFVFAVNLKTAKALGVTIPATLLQRADRVIE